MFGTVWTFFWYFWNLLKVADYYWTDLQVISFSFLLKLLRRLVSTMHLLALLWRIGAQGPNKVQCNRVSFSEPYSKRAHVENNIHHDKRFHSWGFQPFLGGLSNWYCLDGAPGQSNIEPQSFSQSESDFKVSVWNPILDKRFDVCEIENAIYVHKYHPKELECIWTKFNEHRLKAIIKISRDLYYTVKGHLETCSHDTYTVQSIQEEAPEWRLTIIMILESFARIQITNMKKSGNLVTVIFGINRKNFHRPFLMALIIIDVGPMLRMLSVQPTR